MRRTINASIVAVALLGAAAPAVAQARATVRGASVRLTRVDGGRVSGELLAAARDSVWLLDRREMTALPLTLVRSVQVRRPGLGPSGILIWTLVGGAATGAALTAACESFTADCGGIFVGTMISWGIVGGISAAITRSPHRRLAPEAPALAPYARFPQGLPPGLSPRDGSGSSAPPP